MLAIRGVVSQGHLPSLLATFGIRDTAVRLRNGEEVQLPGIDGESGGVVLDKVHLCTQLFVVRFEARNLLYAGREHILVGAALQGFGRQGAVVGLAFLRGLGFFVQPVFVDGRLVWTTLATCRTLTGYSSGGCPSAIAT